MPSEIGFNLLRSLEFVRDFSRQAVLHSNVQNFTEVQQIIKGSFPLAPAELGSGANITGIRGQPVNLQSHFIDIYG